MPVAAAGRLVRRAGGVRAFGLASTARWLTHCCGLSHRTAVDHVRVARALAAHPRLAQAMAAGRLSYSHVRAIARVAKVGEERTVDDLIEVAGAGTVGQLETVVRGLRTVETNDGDVAAEPYVRTGWTSSSQWRLGARLDPERGAVVDKALATLAAAEGISRPEALERIAEIALVVLRTRRPRAAPARRRARGGGRPPRRRLRPRRGSSPDPQSDSDDGRSDDSAPMRARLDDGPGLPRAVSRAVDLQRPAAHRAAPQGRLVVRPRPLAAARVAAAVPGAAHARRRLFPPWLPLTRRTRGAPRPALALGRTDRPRQPRPAVPLPPSRPPPRRVLHRHRRRRVVRVPATGRARARTARRPDPTHARRPAAGDSITPLPRWTGTGERLDRAWAIAVLAHRRERGRQPLPLAG